MERNLDAGILVLRIALGALMLFHGIHKLIHGVESIEEMLVQHDLPQILAWGVYVGEIIAPILIILGYRTRLAAGVYAFNMLVAILFVHAGKILSVADTGAWGIELVGLYFLGAISLCFTGGGKYTVSVSTIWD